MPGRGPRVGHGPFHRLDGAGHDSSSAIFGVDGSLRRDWGSIGGCRADKIERQELSWKTAANCWTLLTSMRSSSAAASVRGRASSSASRLRLKTFCGVLERSEATVRRQLEKAHGKTLLRNLFDGNWPGDRGAETASPDSTGTSLPRLKPEGARAMVSTRSGRLGAPEPSRSHR
jgi:hypothetical protein